MPPPRIRGQLGLPFPLPFPMSQSVDTVVIGAGISGLVHAHARGPSARVVVLDSADRPGGLLWTVEEQGASFELGPETLPTGSEATTQLLSELGLEPRLAPPAAQRRYVVQNGRPVALPQSPPALLATPLLSMRAKLRLLREPWRQREVALDGSLADFIRHRLGPEPLAAFVDPFVSGIYAGDPELLSLRAAFPRLRELVHEHGSLVAGMRAHAKQARREGRASGPGVLTLAAGLGSLARTIADLLGQRLMLGTPVRELRPSPGGWRVDCDEHSYLARRVVLATSARAASKLLGNVAPELSLALRQIVHESLAVVVTRWKRDQVDHPLDGFGCLCPSREGLRHLGTLFSSTLRPESCAPNEVLLRTFVGGARNPSVLDASDTDLVALVCSELAPLLGIHGGPSFQRVIRWPEVLPRYDLEHPARVRQVESALTGYPGLELLGNYLHGIGLVSLIERSRAAAQRAARAANHTTGT